MAGLDPTQVGCAVWCGWPRGDISLLAGEPRVWVITRRRAPLQEPGAPSPRTSASCFEFLSLSVQSSLVFPRL